MTSLKVVGWRVEDALTGEQLSGKVFTKTYAETLFNRLKKKHPAAFIKKVTD
jgi:hypothetical protein